MTDDDTKALTVRDDAKAPAIASELTIDALAGRMQKIRTALKSVLVEGHDYGTIPGCGPKPALLQPGAQKLALMFGLAPRFRVQRIDLPDGHREYEVACTLRHLATGIDVGEGIGLCTTMERKYRYRRGAENQDLADCFNVVAKMAAKRALVAAVLTAVGASDVLSQDLEDMPRDEESQPRQSHRRESRPSPPQEAAHEPGEEEVVDMIRRIYGAENVDELKAFAPSINAMPRGSAARRACRASYDERVAKLTTR